MPEKVQTVHVIWYEHNCPWISKSCDEFCLVSANVPVSVLAQYKTEK